MQILSVSLKNFKTHQDKHFTFAPGTNAICGENGAGKSSILEAIAWVLFNYQGDYAKDDLIRNGSGSAQATVEFISSQDGRTYTVQRSTSRGYTLFDPQLNQRLPYSRIKDEVLPWLREHLGVSPGTDLGELFARTLGVPQGTFTADFLQTPEARKAVFDKILKVEEYKTAHRELNSLRQHAEGQVATVEQTIARYDEQLQAWEDLQQRHQALTRSIEHDEARLQALEIRLAELQQDRDTCKAQAEQVQTLQTAAQRLASQITGQQQSQTLLQQSLQQAEQAAHRCQATRSAYDAYQAAETQLQQLNQQQQQRQRLQQQQQRLQQTLDQRAADITRLQLQLDRFAEDAAEIEQLQPQVEEQKRLEAALTQVQTELQALAQVRGELQATQQQQAQLARQQAQVNQAIAHLETLSKKLAVIPEWEQQRDRLQQQLSRLEAGQQFEAELRRLVHSGQAACDHYQAQTQTALETLDTLQQSIPLLSAESVEAVRSALETGLSVNQDIVQKVQHILDDLTPQTNAAALQEQLQERRQRLETLYAQRAEVATLPQRQQQQQDLQQQQQTLTQQVTTLEQRLARSETLQTEVNRLQAALTALEDPRGRCAVLEKSRQQQPAIAKRHSEMTAAQAGIQRQIEALSEQLQQFADLDAAIAQQNQAKQTHQAGYREYLQNEKTAQEQPRLAAELAQAQAQLAHLQQQAAETQQQLQAAQETYDPQRAEAIEATYQDSRSQRDRLAGSLPQQQHLLQELQQQLDALQALAQKRAAAVADRQRRDRVRRFINFARKAYKEAGPRITERYIHQISREADRLFRELLNRQNVALTWTRDYEIQVQEGPNNRRFVNLSGGEQMCAALAVRLALLKVLADIDIAFFDEPTTNMDRARRESLAEAIGRIKSFQQLFVISHDDTFEKVTENVIVVEREV